MQKEMLKRIKVFSAVLKWIFIAVLVLYPLSYIVATIVGFLVEKTSFDIQQQVGVWFLLRFPIVHFFGLPTSIQVAGVIISFIPVALFMVKNYYLARLFSLYQKGVVFSLDNVRYIRNIGIFMLITECFRPFYQIFISLLLSSQKPAGEHQIHFTVSGTDLSMIVMSIIIIVVSWIMREGVELEQEHKLVV